jgi:Transposase IS66 family
MLEDLDLTRIPDEATRASVGQLLNLVEELTAALRTAQAAIQQLRDENQRLKGEQGKPHFPGNAPRRSARDISSERERHTPQAWTKTPKLPFVRIDREEVLTIAPPLLPPDSEFKGYEAVVVQELRLQTDTVRFLKAKYYSPSARQTYLAALPPGYRGAFGPGLRALTLALYFEAGVTAPKLHALYRSVGIHISTGHVAALLIQDHEPFHAEQAAVWTAGLASSPWQHTDDTTTRVNGQQHYCHIVCNPLFTAFRTLPGKDRLTILDLLRPGQPRAYLLNAEAEQWLAQTPLAAAVRAQVARLPHDVRWDEATLTAVLAAHLPQLGPQQQRWLRDALAIAAYQAQTDGPVVQTLVSDDAPQFHGVTTAQALCWIHEGRHYKKLLPVLAPHREHLAAFLTQFWAYYAALRAYQQAPTAAERERLAAAFDELFARRTGYWALDDRIAKTAAKRPALLHVLDHPEVPLHNNPAELAARQRVRKRDISFGPRTAAGARAWDTFQSLAATTAKLGVSFYTYLHDRLTQADRLPSLAQLITDRAPSLNLAASWNSS